MFHQSTIDHSFGMQSSLRWSNICGLLLICETTLGRVADHRWMIHMTILPPFQIIIYLIFTSNLIIRLIKKIMHNITLFVVVCFIDKKSSKGLKFDLNKMNGHLR